MKILFIIQIMKLRLGEVKGFVPNSHSMSTAPPKSAYRKYTWVNQVAP